MSEASVHRSCPRCKAQHLGHPALSRRDEETEICPDCGIAKALQAAGCNTALINDLMAEADEYSEADEVADAQRSHHDPRDSP